MRGHALLSSVVAASVAAACAGAPPAKGPARPAPPARAEAAPRSEVSVIDAAIREAWRARGVTPAPRADDATFLRRAYLDVVGTIPPPEVTLAFLADPSPDKRAKLVERLVSSPEYAEHWTSYWDDALMGRDARGPAVDRAAFRAFLRARFAANTPWDELVRELVSATGLNSEGGPRVGLPKAIAATDRSDPPPDVNGAVNWTLRYQRAPQDLAGDASRIFLGVQIQCAQCHDHKTEKWTQRDFRRLSAAFLHARTRPADPRRRARMKKKGVRRVELVDAPRVPRRFARKPELREIARAKPTALDGTDLDRGRGTREALAAWMTAKDNPWFAKALVNRMWGHFLGRGFFDPVDDLRADNPPVLPALLDRMARDFVASGYDLRALIRTICATEVYQLDARAEGGGAEPAPLWSRFRLVPLGPEERFHALLGATAIERAADEAGLDLERLRIAAARRYVFLFDTDEESDTPDYAGSVTQALALLNGRLVGKASRALPGSALAEILARRAPAGDKIDALVVRVLARHATAEERARWSHEMHTKRDYEDLLWALLNSSEFNFNH